MFTQYFPVRKIQFCLDLPWCKRLTNAATAKWCSYLSYCFNCWWLSAGLSWLFQMCLYWYPSFIQTCCDKFQEPETFCGWVFTQSHTLQGSQKYFGDSLQKILHLKSFFRHLFSWMKFILQQTVFFFFLLTDVRMSPEIPCMHPLPFKCLQAEMFSCF